MIQGCSRQHDVNGRLRCAARLSEVSGGYRLGFRTICSTCWELNSRRTCRTKCGTTRKNIEEFDVEMPAACYNEDSRGVRFGERRYQP